MYLGVDHEPGVCDVRSETGLIWLNIKGTHHPPLSLRHKNLSTWTEPNSARALLVYIRGEGVSVTASYYRPKDLPASCPMAQAAGPALPFEQRRLSRFDVISCHSPLTLG